MEAIRLRERLKVVQSDEYRETVRLTQAIKAEEAAIKRSTQEMRNKTKQMRVANQVAAGMRATFAGLQTSFGMFTSLSLIHISEPTRQAEISYAVFCLKKK